jgi:hypothetical protein
MMDKTPKKLTVLNIQPLKQKYLYAYFKWPLALFAFTCNLFQSPKIRIIIPTIDGYICINEVLTREFKLSKEFHLDQYLTG